MTAEIEKIFELTESLNPHERETLIYTLLEQEKYSASKNFQLVRIADKFVYLIELPDKYQADMTSSFMRKKPVYGCMKGLVRYMAPDFNDPIDDFKEYM